jgi:hypothetical protein
MANTGNDPQAIARERERTHLITAFDAYAGRFMADYKKHRWKDRTYASAESNMRRWVIPAIHKRPIVDIKRQELVNVFDSLRQDSPTLRRAIFALLRKLFGWAVERGDIERSPFEQMRSPPLLPIETESCPMKSSVPFFSRPWTSAHHSMR